MDIYQIDEWLEKLKELKIEYNAVNELMSNERYLNSKDVAELLGVSEATARSYMNRRDFPRLDCGKGYKVSATAFFLYNLKQRI